jgi:probable F420-dependent oxidoreductase
VSARDLGETARRAEDLGYDALVIPDHLIEQLSPVPALAVIAAATERLRVAAFVFNNDLRHPAVLAQDLASLDVLSEGRLDVAIGAGWNVPEYRATGIPFDPAPVRQARLAEAITVLKGCFGEGPFSFQGRHYTITELDGQPKPVQHPHPPFMIGGGGRVTLELAGREAQIASFSPRIRGRRTDLESITPAAVAEKVEWVRAAAGDRFPQIELNIYPTLIGPIVSEHPRAAAEAGAAEISARRGEPVSAAQLLESPHVFINSVDGFVERFRELRERFGISSFMVGEMGPLDSVVSRLAGS